jgi:hypothetical protein
LFFSSFRDLSVELQNKQNLERVICLLSGSDYVSWVAYLREKALNDEERPAVRMRALTALQAALTEDQMMEHMELHSYTLNLRIKVLNFLSRLEVLGLVYKVLYASTYAFSACRNYTFPYFC